MRFRKNKPGTSQRARRHRDRHPDAAFKFLQSLLNGKNISHLLRICAGLSCYESFSPFSPPWGLKKYINYPHNRAFFYAILESRASVGSRSHLLHAELPKILNNARDASYDPEALTPVTKLSGKPGVELEAHRFFARMGNIQIMHREHNPIIAAGRAIAMLEVMPVSRRQWLPERFQRLADVLAVEFPSILGSSIRDLARVHTALLLYCQANFNRLLAELPPVERESVSEEERLFALLNLVLTLADTREPFGFSPTDIAAWTGGQVSEEQIINFIRLFGRTVTEQRSLLQEPAYQLGHIASRLSPLERYPIVTLSPTDNLIPCATLFGKSFSHVVDYTLFDECKKRHLGSGYSEFRGAMQEIYLRQLLEECLPDLLCAPERQYGKQHKRGPDLTLVDRSSNRLIVIETKSRRMRADTVALMSDEVIKENLEDAFDALLKLPKKIEHLYSHLPEYSDIQDCLNATKANQPLCIVVLSNSVFSLSEIVRLQIEGNSEHPLKGYPHPFSIISLDTFEKAVEIAGSTGPSLAALFDEHWQVSGVFDPSTHIADMFKERAIPETKQRFAVRYFSG